MDAADCKENGLGTPAGTAFVGVGPGHGARQDPDLNG
jgi:hypothetical protein